MELELEAVRAVDLELHPERPALAARHVLDAAPIRQEEGLLERVAGRAEDSEAIRTAIVTLLRKRGYKTLIALNGEEAVELARQEQPDLILMDIKMPVMDGIEALRVIRRDIRLQAVPVVMLTSITNLNTVTEAIESGANDYIAKPFKVFKLLERVEKYVHASTPSSSQSIGTAEEEGA